MAPKSSSSSSKKKSTAGSGNADPKFKLPAEFITRPHPSEDHEEETCTAYIHPNVLSTLGVNPGSFCTISKVGENGILVIAKADNEETHPVNVITLSNTIRSVGNIILGDRLELKKAQVQPPYATKIAIGSLQECNILECIDEKVIQKLLNDSGIIMPGMIFRNLKTKTGDGSIDVVITDTSDGSLPDVSQLDLNSDEVYGSSNGQYYLSPPSIFRKGSTHIAFTKEMQASRKYNLPEPISYAAVGGLNKEIESLKSAIEIPLHQPTLFSSFGVSPPRGILLHGPPGTGKTMLLRVVANTSNAHVLTINGPSIVSKYLGETESALREIFNEARKYQPSIIFIDEIDSIAPNRANDDSGEVESRVVATLLTLMDGMGAAGRLIVIAATNRPNCVDPALRRPGRFDQEVEIGIPDVDARFDILTRQFSKMSPDRHALNLEEIKHIASKTHGYVGADLTALCRESVMKTIQRGLGMDADIDKFSLIVTLKDVESAMVDIRPSAMREIFLEMPKVYWSDIGGQDELKTKMKEMIQLPLEASETFARLGISAPKGVLLYGPPGCSKTLTAKALATESGINFFAVKGPEVFNKYVGESERAIREIFRKARSAAPSIIFFDEIDALSPVRDGGSTSAANHVLTSLLNEIDGVEELKGVVIVAATNRPDEIDGALLRPGRLDRHIYVGPPDANARLEILKKCTKKFNTKGSGVDLQELAARTKGYSGAEVVLLCQEAGLAAIMEDLDVTKVEFRHFEKAFKGIARGITPEMLLYYEEFALRSGSSS
ncbi:hypothetical protein SKDZ_12G4230 [Saccharomyces kudriavzevii ZP591]|nr:hypothetical protein SKDZ_12G4230 [Saccharomyces kudriavzevii ZP591]